MGAWLVLSEVQVNIGYLVYQIKEGLKWNILTVLAQLVTTFWAGPYPACRSQNHKIHP